MQVPLILLARMAKPARMPAFKGKKDDYPYQQYKQMLDSLPEESMQRLALIKRVEVTETPYETPRDHRPHAKLARRLSDTLEKTDNNLKRIIDEYMQLFQDKQHPDPSRALDADGRLEDLRQAIFVTFKERGYDWFGNKKISQK